MSEVLYESRTLIIIASDSVNEALHLAQKTLKVTEPNIEIKPAEEWLPLSRYKQVKRFIAKKVQNAPCPACDKGHLELKGNVVHCKLCDFSDLSIPISDLPQVGPYSIGLALNDFINSPDIGDLLDRVSIDSPNLPSSITHKLDSLLFDLESAYHAGSSIADIERLRQNAGNILGGIKTLLSQ